jgi:hypothetical protein
VIYALSLLLLVCFVSIYFLIKGWGRDMLRIQNLEYQLFSLKMQLDLEKIQSTEYTKDEEQKRNLQ